VVLELRSDHTELFKQFSDNSSLKRRLTDMVFDSTYQPGAIPPRHDLREHRHDKN
jgi:type I restriction enzyme R subunit